MSDWPGSVDELSAIERASLLAFIGSCAPHLGGRVLDYGCGRQPYRAIVEAAGGDYCPLDRAGLPGGSGGDIGEETGRYDAALCNQVIQYVPHPRAMLDTLHDHLTPGGVLILTGPTCWIEPPGHLHSYTIEGVKRLLSQSHFQVERIESRGHVGPGFSIGYGAVART